MITKIGCVLIGIASLQLQARSYSQTITLNTREASLEQIFKAIEEQSGYVVLYNYGELRRAKPVSISVANLAIKPFLDKLFADQPFAYTIEEKTILVSAKSNQAKIPPSDDPLLPRKVQGRIVSGNVYDESGNPLEGVTVAVENTAAVTMTNSEGHYRIAIPTKGTVLVFRILGFQAVEQPIGNQTSINVTMKTSVSDLEEVVVVGYGTVRRSDLTGSVSRVQLEGVNETPVLSADEFLQGRAAGVQITQNTGAPGGGVSFLVRGANSVTGSTQPLIVLDGYPIESSPSLSTPTTGADSWTANMPEANPLANLNPSEIESIEILKDASAISIYGSRGANGVILITTKRGQAGKERITLNSRFSINNLQRQLEVLNTQEFIAFSNEGHLNSGLDSAYTQAQIAQFEGRNYHWQDLIYQEAFSQDYQATLSGGVERFKYLLSFNYMNAEGIVRNSGFGRGSVRLNIDREVNKRFRFGFNTNAVQSLNKLATQSHTNGAASGSVVMGALLFRPIDTPYSLADPDEINIDLQGNPLTLINLLKDETERQTFVLNGFADYKLNDYLAFRVNTGINNIASTRQVYHPRGTNQGDANNGLATQIESTNFNYLTEYTLNYVREINQRHSINAVGGYTWQEWRTRSIGATATNFPNDKLGYNNFQIASNAQIPVTANMRWALASVLGRINYVFDDRYLLTLTGRMDGSTRLAENNKWAFFPAVAVGWNIHREPFMQQQRTISLLKLTASYGVSGNQAIGVGATQSTLKPIRRPFAGGIFTALTLNSFENPDLHWERTNQLNAAIELGFFKNRLNVGVTYYEKNTHDLLLDLTLPGSAGFPSYAANSGQITNKGIEVEASATILDGSKLKWSASGNISFNRNKVVHLGGTQRIIGPYFLQSGNQNMNAAVNIVQPGYPIGAFYGYRVIGIYQNEQEIADGPVDSTNPQPGDFRFADVNRDGQINLNDLAIIGNPYPDLNFGLSNDFKWGNLSVSMLFTGAIGQDVANLNRFQLDGLYAGYNLNVSREAYLNRWVGEGTSNRYPRPTATGISFRQRFSDFIVEDASYVRLRTLTVAYDVPLKWQAVRSVRLFANANNLLTFTNYAGYDPEINAKGNNPITQGIDLGSIPQVRTYSAGFTLNF